MWRIVCDFNDRDAEDRHPTLWFDTGQLAADVRTGVLARATRVSGSAVPLQDCVEAAGIVPGLRVLMTVLEGDFEVAGVVSFGPLVFAREAPTMPCWYAIPDWRTLVQFESPPSS